MKTFFKSTVVLFALLFSIMKGNAQDNSEKPKKNFFGIVAGASVSSITNYDGKPLIGFTGGLYWDWKFSEKFALSSNILFNQRGENENGDAESLKLGYIYSPIMLKYMLNEKVSVASGVFWDNLITVGDNSIHNWETLRRSDFGIPITINFSISQRVELGACYNFGLLNTSYFPETTLKNNWGTMTIAYVFR